MSKSLVQTNLLNHRDKDVKLLVAVCFIEVMRVLAPDPPFSDEIFKVLNSHGTCTTVFGDVKYYLIVTSFSTELQSFVTLENK